MMRIYILLCLILSVPAWAEMKLVDRSGGKGNFIYEKDPTSFITTVIVSVSAGSMGDTKGREGLANLSFESLLRGTRKLDRKDFIFAIEELGADISVNVGTDKVIFTLSAISSNVQQAISLLGDIFLDRFLRKNRLNELKKEKIGALGNTRYDLRSMTDLAFRLALFTNSALAHPSEGTINGLKFITHKEVISFLNKNIVQQKFLFAVSSNIEKPKVKSWIQKSFGRMKVGKGEGTGLSLFRVQPHIAKLSGRHVVIFPQKEGGLTQIFIGHSSVPSTFKNALSLRDVGSFSFGGGASGRLFTELRVKKGWTYGAYASFRLFDLPRYYGSVFQMYTFPNKEFTQKALFKTIDLYENYVNKGITKEEKKFAINFRYNSYAFIFEKATTRILKRLYQALEGAPFLSVEEYRAKLKAVNMSRLNSMIKTGTYVVAGSGNKEERRKIHDPHNMIIALGGDLKLLEPIAKKIPGVVSIKIIRNPILQVPPVVENVAIPLKVKK